MSDPLFSNLQRHFADRYQGAVISHFQFVTSGWESDVYSFALHLPGKPAQFLILRLYPNRNAVPKMQREARGLRLLQEAGYPVPTLFFMETQSELPNDPDTLRAPTAITTPEAPIPDTEHPIPEHRLFADRPFILMEKLEGEALWPLLAAATSHTAETLLDEFGRLLARLHQLDWRPFTENAARYEAEPVTLLRELLASSRQLCTRFDVPGFLPVVDWLEALQGDLTVRPAVAHLDFHANNVFLCKDGRWAVIDWTQVTVADYRADLCWTLMIMGDFGHPQWGECILKAYRSAVNAPIENLDYFQVITCMKILASTVISLKASPQELGLRPDTVQSIGSQAPVLRKLSQRIEDITSIAIPEVETALSPFG